MPLFFYVESAIWKREHPVSLRDTGWSQEPTESKSVSSVAQQRPTLCDPVNRSTPGLPVHHQLPEFTQTHAHRVRDAIQPSHPLSSHSGLDSSNSGVSVLETWFGHCTEDTK